MSEIQIKTEFKVGKYSLFSVLLNYPSFKYMENYN